VLITTTPFQRRGHLVVDRAGIKRSRTRSARLMISEVIDKAVSNETAGDLPDRHAT
jgi:hypothetical protein